LAGCPPQRPPIRRVLATRRNLPHHQPSCLHQPVMPSMHRAKSVVSWAACARTAQEARRAYTPCSSRAPCPPPQRAQHRPISSAAHTRHTNSHTTPPVVDSVMRGVSFLCLERPPSPASRFSRVILPPGQNGPQPTPGCTPACNGEDKANAPQAPAPPRGNASLLRRTLSLSCCGGGGARPSLDKQQDYGSGGSGRVVHVSVSQRPTVDDQAARCRAGAAPQLPPASPASHDAGKAQSCDESSSYGIGQAAEACAGSGAVEAAGAQLRAAPVAALGPPLRRAVSAGLPSFSSSDGDPLGGGWHGRSCGGGSGFGASGELSVFEVSLGYERDKSHDPSRMR
jgi:hypothetical protein